MSQVFDERESRRLEANYLTPDIVEQRAKVRAALALRAGEHVVDLGCGPGLLVAEMEQEVGASGSIRGIDASESMVALARVRCASMANVEIQVGDVATLPYADRSFDVAVCTQVYEYVPDVDRALSELNRVLKPGGRAVIVDSDWESCVWNSSDDARMRRMLDCWNAHCAHPHLPRTLKGQLERAGFVDVSVQTIVIINDRYDTNTYGYGMMQALRAWGRKHLETGEADAWAADLEAQQHNDYFFSLNRYLFSARKG